MLAKIRALLAPPTFGDNKDKNRHARINYFMLLAVCFVLVLLLFFVRPLTSAEAFFSLNNLVIFLLLLGMVGLIWILRRGHVRVTSYALISFTWLALAYLAAINDGIRDTSYVLLIIPILIAGLLLGWRASVGLIGLTVLIGWGFVFAENAGYVAPDADTPAQLARDLTTLLILMAVLIYLIISNLQNALNETRQSNKELQTLSINLDRRTVELAQANIQLQEEIKERKRAEKQLLASLEEKERLIKELQNFTYISTHDLQEPLRKIQALGSRISYSYADVLEEKGQDYLNRMQEAASKMQTMIQDLLEFSQISSGAQSLQEVNLIEVITAALSSLDTPIKEAGAVVNVSELPVIDADPAQMQQLFQHLIFNALKFHQLDQQPVIEIYGNIVQRANIDGEPDQKWCDIHVQDNGIGFDEKHAEHIFGVFTRLHTGEAYSGNGIGLAICRRIVERHNGKITATGEPGHGSEFIVTLPVTNHAIRND